MGGIEGGANPFAGAGGNPFGDGAGVADAMKKLTKPSPSGSRHKKQCAIQKLVLAQTNSRVMAAVQERVILC
eukprot:scaffold11174_cov76-Alexandrium_tamarense.AAC.1